MLGCMRGHVRILQHGWSNRKIHCSPKKAKPNKVTSYLERFTFHYKNKIQKPVPFQLQDFKYILFQPKMEPVDPGIWNIRSVTRHRWPNHWEHWGFFGQLFPLGMCEWGSQATRVLLPIKSSVEVHRKKEDFQLGKLTRYQYFSAILTIQQLLLKRASFERSCFFLLC